MNTIILLSSLLSFPLKRKPNSWKNGIYSSYQPHIYSCLFMFLCFFSLSTRWSKTHDLLIEGGLTYDAIKDSVANSSIAFRDGVAELFEFLEVYESKLMIAVILAFVYIN